MARELVLAHQAFSISVPYRPMLIKILKLRYENDKILRRSNVFSKKFCPSMSKGITGSAHRIKRLETPDLDDNFAHPPHASSPSYSIHTMYTQHTIILYKCHSRDLIIAYLCSYGFVMFGMF